MSYQLDDYDPTLGNGNILTQINTENMRIKIVNDSPYDLIIRFPGSRNVDRMEPGEANVFALHPGDNVLTVVPFLELSQSSYPAHLVHFIIYNPEDKILGSYPIYFGRATNVGNSVTTSNTSGVKNDGQAPATSVFETTPNDEAVSDFNYFNDGSGSRHVLSAGASRVVDNVVRGNATTTKAVIQFGDSADKTITTFYGIHSGSIDATVNIPAAQVQPGSFATGNFTVTGTIFFGNAGAAANELIDLQQGYGIYSDNVGQTFTGAVSRLWFDSPLNGEMHFGGRASPNILAGIRFRTKTMILDNNVVNTTVITGYFQTTTPSTTGVPPGALWINTGL